MEAEQAQREMRLQCREAIDNRQREEMVLARSLALDRREKVLAERERALSEAATKAFSRFAQRMELLVMKADTVLDEHRCKSWVSTDRTYHEGRSSKARCEAGQ